MADQSFPQYRSTAKTGSLSTTSPIQIVKCFATVLPFLPSSNPHARATVACSPDRRSVRISLPTLRDVDWLQDRQSINDCSRYLASTTIEMIRILSLITQKQNVQIRRGSESSQKHRFSNHLPRTLFEVEQLIRWDFVKPRNTSS